jgi:hypothetical protein
MRPPCRTLAAWRTHSLGGPHALPRNAVRSAALLCLTSRGTSSPAGGRAHAPGRVATPAPAASGEFQL